VCGVGLKVGSHEGWYLDLDGIKVGVTWAWDLEVIRWSWAQSGVTWTWYADLIKGGLGYVDLETKGSGGGGGG
jgi:hypothetical protein